jgi:hypothetical protein
MLFPLPQLLCQGCWDLNGRQFLITNQPGHGVVVTVGWIHGYNNAMNLTLFAKNELGVDYKDTVFQRETVSYVSKRIMFNIQ